MIYGSSELFDAATDTFTSAGDLSMPRHKHDAMLLADGRVLISGGADERDDRGQYASTEIYDPDSGGFAPLADMRTPRYKFYGTSLLLEDGMVLLLGGSAVTEIFEPKISSFMRLEGGPGVVRLFATGTLLPGGRALFAGGYGTNTSASRQAWVISPK